MASITNGDQENEPLRNAADHDTERLGDVEAAIEAARRWTTPEPMMAVRAPVAGRGPSDAAMVIAVPGGVTLKSIKPFLDEFLERPERREGVARHTTLGSFCDHVKRHAGPQSAIFAHDDPRAPRLVAVIDYHEPGPEGRAGWGKHRAEYAFPVTDEWKAWTGSKDPMNQRAFAEFLEDHIVDVIDPTEAGDKVQEFAERLGGTLASPSALMSLSKHLSLRVDSKVTQAVNLGTGEVQVSYEEQHNDKHGVGPVRVPGGFAIAIPVFKDGPAYKLPVRLRYRVSAGNIHWILGVHRADLAFADAFEEACESTAAVTELPVFRGTPDA